MAKSTALFLLALALVATSTGRAFAESWGDGDLLQRQKAMEEAVRVMANYDPASNDPQPQAVQRAVATVNGELALLRPIFNAIGKMPEGSAAEVRAKEEARATANVLLTRHLGELLPVGSVKMEEL